MRVEEAVGSRSHPTPGNSSHSKSPASMAAGSSPLEGMGRQRLVSAGQGGLEDPCAGRGTRILLRFSQTLGVNIYLRLKVSQ